MGWVMRVLCTTDATSGDRRPRRFARICGCPSAATAAFFGEAMHKFVSRGRSLANPVAISTNCESSRAIRSTRPRFVSWLSPAPDHGFSDQRYDRDAHP